MLSHINNIKKALLKLKSNQILVILGNLDNLSKNKKQLLKDNPFNLIKNLILIILEILDFKTLIKINSLNNNNKHNNNNNLLGLQIPLKILKSNNNSQFLI